MAYENYGGGRGVERTSFPQKPVEPMREFPKDTYVDEAEALMSKKEVQVRKRVYKLREIITTSKLRNILSLLMDVYNVENLRTEEKISEESKVKLQMARIRIAYESGRDQNVGVFVKEANLLPWLKEVGDSREMVICYIHYLEALVAYHRFYGGKEN